VSPPGAISPIGGQFGGGSHFFRSKVTWPELQRISISLYFEDSESFEVINVRTRSKLNRSVFYDEQQVCVYQQPFSH